MPQDSTHHDSTSCCCDNKKPSKNTFPCTTPSYLYIACQWNLNEFFFLVPFIFDKLRNALRHSISFWKTHTFCCRNNLRQDNQCQYPAFHLSLPPLNCFSIYTAFHDVFLMLSQALITSSRTFLQAKW